MDLIEFLLARIAEDEAVARAVIAERDQIPWAPGYEPDTSDTSAYADMDASVPHVAVGPERVLAECEVKRRIVERHSPVGYIDDEPTCRYCTAIVDGGYRHRPAPWPCPDVRDLAAVYAEHPEYRDAWRP